MKTKIAFAILALGLVLPSSARDPVADYEAVKKLVTDRLLAPATAVFPPLTSIKFDYPVPNILTVSGFVDSQNTYSALLRSKWVVVANKGDLTKPIVCIGDDEIAEAERELEALKPENIAERKRVREERAKQAAEYEAAESAKNRAEMEAAFGK